ncbi:MAG: D-alanyl-D-alanine carboxypeptidase [Xanthobacteraceae bacterium]
MLRTLGNARGFRKVLVGLLTGIAVLAVAIDSVDAKRRRHKRRSSYNPPYAGIVVDANSGKVLYADRADARRHPASLTKIMTLYLLFERLEAGKLKLDSKLEVSKHASRQPPTKLGLKPGQTIQVEDAILALVTRSANDVAVVVAEAIAGDQDDFAKLMTRKARALGMDHTVYKNASGLPNKNQITTARDQARLGRAIRDRFPKYYRYFARRSFKFRGNRIRNHNALLGSVRGVDGIKTGYIRASGFNLVASMKRNDRYLVAAVFGGKSSSRRNRHMSNLLTKYIKKASTKRTTPLIAEVPVSDSEPISVATAKAVPAKPIRSTIVRRSAHRRGPATTASVAARRRTRGAIKPIAVKTIKVKLTGAKTASLTSPLSRALTPTPAAKPSSAPAGIQVASAGAESIPASAVEAVAPIPGAQDSEAASPKRTGWMIQVGAFATERDAKNRLRSARSKARHLLGDADPFTETVVKDEKTFYRARFADLDKREAIAACRYLKRKDYACMTLKN